MMENDNATFLRTVLRKTTQQRLQTFCQQFSTGNGHWDYGVGIDILLDFWDYSHNVPTVAMLNEKLDVLLDKVMEEKQVLKDEVKEDTNYIEMLGGERIKK